MGIGVHAKATDCDEKKPRDRTLVQSRYLAQIRDMLPHSSVFLLVGSLIVLPAHARTAPVRGPDPQATARTHNLIPVPASVAWGRGVLRLDSTATIDVVRHEDARLSRAIARFRGRLERRLGAEMSHAPASSAATATFRIDVASAGDAVQSVNENESYTITVDSERVTLQAPTVTGALRGLETLMQLLTQREGRYELPAVAIRDAPRYPWRGLLVDVARHFIPVEGIKRTLDGMAAVKLNVLHWHLTDDQGFRIESKRYPKLQSSGPDGDFYTQEQVRDVVAYARDRGIRIVPEFDMPSHSTTWFIGYPELASIPGTYGIVRTFGGGDASFDPTIEATYRFLDRFIGEIAPLFPDAYWHVGGDEVTARHWNESRRVRAYKRAHGIRTNAQLQGAFNRRLSRILATHGKKMVGWDEILYPGLPKSTVVQSWRSDGRLERATAQGYRGLQSAPYYLDRIKTAEEHYLADVDPSGDGVAAGRGTLVLGGEACMWTEHVNAETIDSRLWPRLGAIAERFWSPREVNDVGDMYRRLNALDAQLLEYDIGRALHIQRMVRRMSPDESVRHAVESLLEAVAPPTFLERIRGQGTTTLTPLVHMIDAAVPDPWGRWETERLVAASVADTQVARSGANELQTQADARDSLVTLFTRWRDALGPIRVGAMTSRFVAEALPIAEALSRASEIGLEALGHLGAGERPEPDWSSRSMVELAAYETPRNLLRLEIVGPVRRLVQAAEAGVSATTGR